MSTESDGLSESQRERLRAKFESGMGHRPDPAEFKRAADRASSVQPMPSPYPKRTLAEIEANADELAQKFMDYEPLTLTDFLLACIAEDEEFAAVQNWSGPGAGSQQERTLRECEAKRRIVEEHRPGRFKPYPPDSEPRQLYACFRCYSDEACATLRALADVYADHPDYREEWKP